ncbi:MAG: AI-2E family transporter, partial [Actinomycetia bacterium]|nr:AI-2E family transporter [Actinomycetes bacterium]
DGGPDPVAGDPASGPPPDAVAAPAPVVRKIEIEGRIIWQAIGAVLTTLFLLWAFNQARSIISMVAISFFFSLALEPLVRGLTRRFEWRRGAAVGVIYLAGFLFVFFMIAILIPSITQLATTVGENGAEWIENISEFTEDTFDYELSSPENAEDVAEDAEAVLGDCVDDPFGTIRS